MTFLECPTTYIGQLGQSTNRTMLEEYSRRNDKSNKELANYYMDVVKALYGTPAYGISGVNKMLNELTDSVRATLNKAKRGKTSAPAHARKLLACIDYYGSQEVVARYNGKYKLKPLLTVEEIQQLVEGVNT